MDENLTIYASLIIEGERIGLERITQMTQLRNESKEKDKDHVWTISSEDKIASDNINKHVEWILDKIESYLPEIELTLKPKRMEISIYWFSKYGHGGPCIESRTIRRLAKNNLTLWVDTYFE
jgi:hypothetical protein